MNDKAPAAYEVSINCIEYRLTFHQDAPGRAEPVSSMMLSLQAILLPALGVASATLSRGADQT